MLMNGREKAMVEELEGEEAEVEVVHHPAGVLVEEQRGPLARILMSYHPKAGGTTVRLAREQMVQQQWN